jgi:Zn-finger nucleic acid-binding protein
MNCSNCGAPMQLDLNQQHFRCDYCTSLYFPKENEDGIRILEAPSELYCPVCEVPLVYGFINNAQIHYCLNCRGMLIDQEIFLMIIDFLRAISTKPPVNPPPVDLEELKRRINCPKCGRQMSTHLYGGPGNLIVDNCTNCILIWLDNNEFNRIIRAPGRPPHRETIDEPDEL